MAEQTYKAFREENAAKIRQNTFRAHRGELLMQATIFKNGTFYDWSSRDGCTDVEKNQFLGIPPIEGYQNQVSYEGVVAYLKSFGLSELSADEIDASLGLRNRTE